jgi:hypothetical protein
VLEALEGPNLYEFVFNTPVNLVDQFGNGAGNGGYPGGRSHGPPSPNSGGCACHQAGGKWEPYWQGKGYKNPIQCANSSLDDILNEYFPRACT